MHRLEGGGADKIKRGKSGCRTPRASIGKGKRREKKRRRETIPWGGPGAQV